MGFLDTLGSIGRSVLSTAGDFVRSDDFRRFGSSALTALANRGLRKAITGSSGDPQSAGGIARLQAGTFSGPSFNPSLGGVTTPGATPPFVPSVATSFDFPRLPAPGSMADRMITGVESLFGGSNVPAEAMPGGAVIARPSGQQSALFRNTATNVRPVREFVVMHPQTGRPIYYKNMGRPVLYSGDYACAKRVQRVARRASRGRR